PTALDFGSTDYNVPVERPVRVTNQGPGVASIENTYATNPKNLVVVQGCYEPLEVGDSCELIVQFTGLDRETSSGNLIITGRSGTLQTVPFVCRGPSGIVQVVPGSLSFAATPIGESAPIQSITVTNVGTAPLSFDGVGVSNTREFGQSNTCGEEVA